MKKVFCTLLVFTILAGTASAQYKKASFFTRNGKFYGLKAGAHLFGHGVAVTPSFAFIWGKDRGKNRIWHWWDMEITTPSKYSYTTTNLRPSATTPAHVSGRIDGMLTWRYNWAFYFADNKNENIKGLPFAKIAVEAVLFGRSGADEVMTPRDAIPAKVTYDEGANGAADIGGGYTYRVNEKTTVFGVAGYRWVLNDASYEAFFPNPSHPYINIGIRFSKKQDD